MAKFTFGDMFLICLRSRGTASKSNSQKWADIPHMDQFQTERTESIGYHTYFIIDHILICIFFCFWNCDAAFLLDLRMALWCGKWQKRGGIRTAFLHFTHTLRHFESNTKSNSKNDVCHEVLYKVHTMNTCIADSNVVSSTLFPIAGLD